MAKAEQLNTTVSPEIYTRFSRIAAERSLSNAALLRDLVEELVEAYDADRAIFQKEAGPRLDTTVSGLVHQLKELVIELDRAQAENARLFGKLIGDWNGGEDANREAQRRLWKRFREQDQQSLAPFKKGVADILTELSDLSAQVSEAINPQLGKIFKELKRSNELAAEPRQMRALVLGDDRMLSLKFLGVCGASLLAFGVLAGLTLPGLFDAWSVFQARRLIDSPAQMCRLIKTEYGRTDCQLPDADRELGLRVIAHEDER